MIKVIIIEDELLVVRGFLKLVNEIDLDIYIEIVLNFVKFSLVYFVFNLEFDLLFMDI